MTTQGSGRNEKEIIHSLCSAVSISAEGYILTNNHVVQMSKK